MCNAKQKIDEALGDINDYCTLNGNASKSYQIVPGKTLNIPASMKNKAIITIRTFGLLITMDIIDAGGNRYFCGFWLPNTITPDTWKTIS